MIPIANSALRRLLTLVWCAAVVSVLGLASQASSAQVFTRSEPVDVVRIASDLDPAVAPPPASVDLGEDAESEGSGSCDDVAVRTDTRWVVAPSSGIVAAIGAARRERLPAHAFASQGHNRGPPQA